MFRNQALVSLWFSIQLGLCKTIGKIQRWWMTFSLSLLAWYSWDVSLSQCFMPHVTSSGPTWAQDNDQPYFILWNMPHLYNRTCHGRCACLFSHLLCLSRNLLIPVCISFLSSYLCVPPWAHCPTCEKRGEGRSPCTLSAQWGTSPHARRPTHRDVGLVNSPFTDLPTRRPNPDSISLWTASLVFELPRSS